MYAATLFRKEAEPLGKSPSKGAEPKGAYVISRGLLFAKGKKRNPLPPALLFSLRQRQKGGGAYASPCPKGATFFVSLQRSRTFGIRKKKGFCLWQKSRPKAKSNEKSKTGGKGKGRGVSKGHLIARQGGAQGIL